MDELNERSVLAIDPGPEESAYLVFNEGRPIQFGKIDNPSLLHQLRRGELGHFDNTRKVAIEMIASYGMPVGAEVFETCVWIGRFIEGVLAGSGKKVPHSFVAKRIRFVYRKDVKMHLCQSMRAKDSNVRQALIDRFGPPGTKKKPGVTYGISGDVWSALAVAVTESDKSDSLE